MNDRQPTTRGLDLVGACLFAATAGWFVLTSVENLGSPLPAIGMLGVAVLAGLLARASGRWLSPAVPAALVVGVASAALLIDGGPPSPLGYANANGTFFLLAAFAALFFWSSARNRMVATAGLVIALVFAVVTILTGSLAASALLALGPGAALATRLGRGRMAVLACAGVFLIAMTATIALGLAHSDEGSVASSALTQRRIALWDEALEIIQHDPVTGAGFDRFEELGPTARSDPDARWAHNEFLQLGAETGIPGLMLLVFLFLWGFTRLTAGAVSTESAVAAAGLAAVGVHASIDYILHFVAIPLSAAVLLGAALAGQHRGGDPFRHDPNSDFDQRPR